MLTFSTSISLDAECAGAEVQKGWVEDWEGAQVWGGGDGRLKAVFSAYCLCGRKKTASSSIKVKLGVWGARKVNVSQHAL